MVPPDPWMLLLAAMVLDAIIGEARWLQRFLPHPIALLGRLIHVLELRLNRPERGAATRRLRGTGLVIGLVGLGILAGGAVQWVTGNLAYGYVFEILVVAFLLAQRSLFEHVLAVARGLERGGLEGGRRAVAHIVGRDPDALDAHGVARAAIESCAENFADGVVAPVFWYLLLGAPGIIVCKVVNTLDSMIGHKNQRFADFGYTAARLDTALNYVPARLSGVILMAAALFVPAARFLPALRTLLRDPAKHRSVNAGWPEAAAAGALGLALAGPRRYGELVVNDPWIGDGRAEATPLDIKRMLYLYVVACLLTLAQVGTLLVLKGGG